MRLWHISLLPYLPKQQFNGQWEEISLFFKNPVNHVLVNFVKDYSEDDLYTYCLALIQERHRRGYKVNTQKFDMWVDIVKPKKVDNPFCNKMTNRYLFQCYINLQEKYDCGGIPEQEWNTLYSYLLTTPIKRYIRLTESI